MSVQTFLQIIGACFGVIGSLFFAIGVMRQTMDAMANLSGTHWNFNPHMVLVRALASQKADYLFGGGFIFIAFLISLISYLFTQSNIAISNKTAGLIPWIAVVSTVVIFFLLRLLAGRVARRFEGQIQQRLQLKIEEEKRKLNDH